MRNFLYSHRIRTTNVQFCVFPNAEELVFIPIFVIDSNLLNNL